MSNIVCVQYTKFQNLNADGSPADEPNLGYRIYDDYGGDYNNCFDTVDEMIEKGLTPEGIFDYILENHESFWEEAMNRGVMLNDVYLPPPEEDDEACAANAETISSTPTSKSTLK